MSIKENQTEIVYPNELFLKMILIRVNNQLKRRKENLEESLALVENQQILDKGLRTLLTLASATLGIPGLVIQALETQMQGIHPTQHPVPQLMDPLTLITIAKTLDSLLPTLLIIHQ